jgi:uncharacterized protein YlzI (FlbEa/FlbD family)
MSGLILVHEHGTSERILLNRDAIVSGRQVIAPDTGQKQSVLQLTEGKSIVVEESLESLVNR